ncbi:MAG: M42 family metallopeptidase [Desulfurococcales archaeon]|nr:M42 family metallopeptidase [Desulfurococcales archaeon]
MDVGLLEGLIRAPGVSGYEDRVRDHIKGLVGGYGVLREDSLGNLLLDLGGEGETLLFAAHMDELGLVVTNVDEDGMVRFRKIGGIDDRVLPNTRVNIHTATGDVPGVIGLTPPHLQLDRGDQRVIPWNELAIDVGASSREEAEELGVRVLDPVTLDKAIVRLGRGNLVASRAIDDRAGCAVLVELARAVAEGEVKPRGRLLLAWTVQEEVGLRGAMALAETVRPDLFIAVDTMSCCLPGITGRTRLGGGPTIRAVDNAYIADRKLVSRVESIARSAGIDYQLATAGGGTDAGALQRRGVKVLALGIPVKYSHSSVEVMNLADLRGMADLVKALSEELLG